jgi:hypothetical protein
MTAVKHAFTELPTIDIREAGDVEKAHLARRAADGVGHRLAPGEIVAGQIADGEADLRPADGGEDELLHRPLQKP